jgi:lipopolysaccharide export system permease protein
MKLYLRYTTLVFLKLFLIIAGALTITATLVQVMLFLSVSVSDLHLDLFSIIKFMLFALPSNFVYVSPIALICTVLYFFHILSSDNELMIFELSGISKLRLAVPAFSVMVVMAVISLAMCSFINPICKKHLLMQRETMHKGIINSVLKEKTFAKISNKLMLYIEKRLDAKDLMGVIIYDKSVPAEVTTILAKHGSFLDDNDKTVFKLYDGSRQTMKNGKLQTLYFKSLIFDVSEYTKKITNFNRVLDSQPLHKLISLQRKRSGDLNWQKKISQELHSRLSWPLLNLVLPILFLFSGLSFGDGRNKNMKKLNIFVSTALSVLCMILYFSIMNRINTKATFSALTYLNLLTFASLGFFLLKLMVEQKLRSGLFKALSITEGH